MRSNAEKNQTECSSGEGVVIKLDGWIASKVCRIPRGELWTGEIHICMLEKGLAIKLITAVGRLERLLCRWNSGYQLEGFKSTSRLPEKRSVVI